MDKDLMGEKNRNEKENEEFKNDFVENSNPNEVVQQLQQPATELEESYEQEHEPNGMDPETIFEKGYSFQESPNELRSQSMNRLGKEPNGINPKDR